MLKKLLDDFLCWIGYYPPTLVNARKQAIENHKIYESALKKAAPKKRPRLYKQATVVTKGELPKEKKAPSKKVVAKTARKTAVARKTVKGTKK